MDNLQVVDEFDILNLNWLRIVGRFGIEKKSGEYSSKYPSTHILF